MGCTQSSSVTNPTSDKSTPVMQEVSMKPTDENAFADIWKYQKDKKAKAEAEKLAKGLFVRTKRFDLFY